MNKKDLRKNILEKRSKLTKKEIVDFSQTILNTLKDLDSYKDAKRIMTFVSMGSEIDTHHLIEEAIGDGKSIVVPITIDSTRELLLSDLFSLSELEIADHNIEIPKKKFTRLVKPGTVDLVLVPGLVFAKNGHRIGYGGGYYDRFLAKLDKAVPKIALGFHLQLVDEVPTNEFDIAVDSIITEKGLLIFEK